MWKNLHRSRNQKNISRAMWIGRGEEFDGTRGVKTSSVQQREMFVPEFASWKTENAAAFSSYVFNPLPRASQLRLCLRVRNTIQINVVQSVRSNLEVRLYSKLRILVQDPRRYAVNLVLDTVMRVRRERHLDDLTSDELVFDSVAELVEFVGQSEVLLGGDECRGWHTAILASICSS